LLATPATLDDQRVTGTIAIPAGRLGRHAHFEHSLRRLTKPDGTVIDWEFGPAVAENRNALVRCALERGSKWILFLDDDHVFASDLLTRLLARRVPVVAALCVRRDPDYGPLVYSHRIPYAPHRKGRLFVRYVLQSHGPDELLAVHAAGTGAMLIRCQVLEAVPAPWFEQGSDLPRQHVLSDASDDFVFCERAHETGFPVYVDLGTRLGHLFTAVVKGRGEVLAASWPVWSQSDGWQSCIDWGRGLEEAWFGESQSDGSLWA
jgi:hypothetical protein